MCVILAHNQDIGKPTLLLIFFGQYEFLSSGYLEPKYRVKFKSFRKPYV